MHALEIYTKLIYFERYISQKMIHYFLIHVKYFLSIPVNDIGDMPRNSIIYIYVRYSLGI